MKIVIPADVPKSMQQEFIQNYEAITHKTNQLMLFAADQKIEHLNRDFFGERVAPEVNNPKHLFEIASQGTIGAFATHFGLITRYGIEYPNINYIVKLNGKTDLVETKQRDPISNALWYVEDLLHAKHDHGLAIRGVGYTVYLGSEFEADMLTEAAQVVYHAHHLGLVAILWMYPRGKAVKNEHDPNLIAGAAGVASSLGADFVKVNIPDGSDGADRASLLKQAVAAAGNTKVLCAGGPSTNPEYFLQELYDQISIAGTAGNATGRNIFQHALPEAIAMTKAISAIVLEGKDVKTALKELS